MTETTDDAVPQGVSRRGFLGVGAGITAAALTASPAANAVEGVRGGAPAGGALPPNVTPKTTVLTVTGTVLASLNSTGSIFPPQGPQVTQDGWVTVKGDAAAGRVPSTIGLHNPIWSDADAVYVADTLFVPEAQPQSWVLWGKLTVVRYPKNNRHAQEAAEVMTAWYDATNVGHRGASVAVTEEGTVIAHASSHGPTYANSTGLYLQRSTRPHAVKATSGRTEDAWSTVMSSPGSVNNSSYYRRFFRDPYTGHLYLVARGNELQVLLLRWVSERQTFVRVDRPNTRRRDTGAGPWVLPGLTHPMAHGTYPTPGGRDDLVPGDTLAVYGHDIAFAKGSGTSSIMYTVPEFMVSEDRQTNGWPRRDISIMRSDDGGHTWRQPGSDPSTGIAPETFRPPMYDPANPSVLVPGNVKVVFPGPPFTASTPHHMRNNAVGARVAVGAGGVPIVGAAWADPDESPGASIEDNRRHRSTWVARVDPETGAVTRTKLVPHRDGLHAAMPTMAYTSSGLVVVVAAEVDDHDMNGNTYVPGEQGYAGTPFPTSSLFAFTSVDGGLTWNRYTIDNGAQTTDESGAFISSSGAYIDTEALERDSVLRLYPAFPGAARKAVVWEVRGIPEIDGMAKGPRPIAKPTLRGVALPGNRVNLSWDMADGGGSAYNWYSVQRTNGVATAASTWTSLLGFDPAKSKGMIDRVASGSTYSYRFFGSTATKGNGPFSDPVTVSYTAPARQAPAGGATPSAWLRAEDVIAATYEGVGTWKSAIPNGPDAVTLDPALRTLSGWNTPLDARPRLICDGPGGRPALRFDRGAKTQLVLPVPAATSTSSFTVIVVARVRDGQVGDRRDGPAQWSQLIGHADADGKMRPNGPASRIDGNALQSHYLGDNGYEKLPHQVGGSIWGTRVVDYGAFDGGSGYGIGSWRVFATRWYVENGVRKVSGSINFCLGNLATEPVQGQPATFPLETPPVPWMTIGAASIGATTFTSAIDVAEVVRFERLLGRGEVRTWVTYLSQVYGLPLTNAVLRDTGAPFDPMTYPLPCVRNPEESDTPHGGQCLP
ncbi:MULTISPECIES: hypothetical protein [Bacteria]|uniref:hypothetical protein n=1 Tax=Bacteria TaxID=2 RepID=UPI003C7EA949